jgi:integrase
MPRIAKPLTAKEVQYEKRPGDYADRDGLYLHVEAGGRSWLFRYRTKDGRRRWHGLGSVSTLSLQAARAEALRLKNLVAADKTFDPIETKRIERKAQAQANSIPTFAEAAELFIAGPKVAEKSKTKWRNTLKTYIYPIFGSDRCQAITTDSVLRAVEPIFADKKEETGRRVCQRVAAVLDYAKAKGWREGDNPAAWEGTLKNLLPERTRADVVHHAAVPFADMPETMAAIRAQDTIKAAVLEFAILTVTRTSEALNADWADIDLDAKIWREVPIAQRNRSKLRFDTPLTDRVVSILEAVPGERIGKVFGKISGNALREALEAAGRSETPHGMRSTFVDWCSEATTISADVREMCLGHTIKNKVEAAYRRGKLFDKRRDALEAWARYCEGSDNVRQLRTA